MSSKYLQNYLNWYAYVDNIKSNKETIKRWFLALLISDKAYQLFGLFKQNTVIIGTWQLILSLVSRKARKDDNAKIRRIK